MRINAVEKCALVAKKRGYKVFAVQDGGMCLSSSTANKTSHIYGISNKCESNGKGGNGANHVYFIGGMKSMFALFVLTNETTMKPGQGIEQQHLSLKTRRCRAMVRLQYG